VLLRWRAMSQTPTYDQLRDERITVAGEVDSAPIDQSGRHRLGEDLAAAPLRDRSPGPEADLTEDGSVFGACHADHRGKHRPGDETSRTTAAGERSRGRGVEFAEDWSWFGPAEPGRAGSGTVEAGMSPPALIERTVAILRVLAELDIRAGDRVLIMLPEGPGFTESFAAVFYRDAMPLPVNPLHCASELTAAITQVHARLVLASLEQLPTLAELLTTPPILIHSSRDQPEPSEHGCVPESCASIPCICAVQTFRVLATGGGVASRLASITPNDRGKPRHPTRSVLSRGGPHLRVGCRSLSLAHHRHQRGDA
jgi:hypothetical protein